MVVLQPLLLRAQPLREVFLQWLSEAAHGEPFTCEGRFTCELQWPLQQAEGSEGERGELDILIQIDQAVIGL